MRGHDPQEGSWTPPSGNAPFQKHFRRRDFKLMSRQPMNRGLHRFSAATQCKGSRPCRALASRVDAHFSVYGQLPLVEVQFNDGFVLVDALNGAVSAPFATASAYDAREMIASHIGLPANEVAARYFSWRGCHLPVSTTWSDTPPAAPRYTPKPPPAGAPAGTIPGQPSGFQCLDRYGWFPGGTGAACACTRTWTYLDTSFTPAREITVTEECVKAGACPTPPSGVLGTCTSRWSW
jgi:hypothetical protein